MPSVEELHCQSKNLKLQAGNLKAIKHLFQGSDNVWGSYIFQLGKSSRYWPDLTTLREVHIPPNLNPQHARDIEPWGMHGTMARWEFCCGCIVMHLQIRVVEQQKR